MVGKPMKQIEHIVGPVIVLTQYEDGIQTITALEAHSVRPEVANILIGLRPAFILQAGFRVMRVIRNSGPAVKFNHDIICRRESLSGSLCAGISYIVGMVS